MGAILNWTTNWASRLLSGSITRSTTTKNKGYFKPRDQEVHLSFLMLQPVIFLTTCIAKLWCLWRHQRHSLLTANMLWLENIPLVAPSCSALLTSVLGWVECEWAFSLRAPSLEHWGWPRPYLAHMYFFHDTAFSLTWAHMLMSCPITLQASLN